MIETQKMNGLCFYEIIEIGRPMTFDTIEIEDDVDKLPVNEVLSREVQ